MIDIYMVHHVHELNDEVDDVKLIGAFASIDIAKSVVEKLSKKPGFASAPDGFFIDKYELNKIYWQEGFDTTE